MTDKPASPFAGIKLSEQTPLAPRGSDQRLFTPTPTPNVQQPTHLPRKEGSQEPSRVGTQMAGKPSHSNPLALPEKPLFDINAAATEKNSYMFSEDELWALRDVESELERTYRTEVSKYNIIRLGLHYLLVLQPWL